VFDTEFIRMGSKMTYQFPFAPDEHVAAARGLVCDKIKSDYSVANVVSVYTEAFEKIFVAGDV
jgi:hypothetical protein